MRTGLRATLVAAEAWAVTKAGATLPATATVPAAAAGADLMICLRFNMIHAPYSTAPENADSMVPPV